VVRDPAVVRGTPHVGDSGAGELGGKSRGRDAETGTPSTESEGPTCPVFPRRCTRGQDFPSGRT